MQNYHQFLDWDQQAKAEATGVAVGWEGLYGHAGDRYLCGCERCGFAYCDTLTDERTRAINAMQQKLPPALRRVAEDVFEEITKESFLRLAYVQGCEHWKAHPNLAHVISWDDASNRAQAMLKFMESRLS